MFLQQNIMKEQSTMIQLDALVKQIAPTKTLVGKALFVCVSLLIILRTFVRQKLTSLFPSDLPWHL